MTTSTKAPKAVSSADVVNTDLKGQLEAVINLEAELGAWEKMVSMLNAGTISVRGGKATLEAANEKGELPTLRVSQVQYFQATAKVRSLKGASDKSLKETINVTIQAKRAFGKEFEANLDKASTYAEFKKSVPSQGEKPKAGRKASQGAELDTADKVLKFALNAWKELETHEIEDMATATKFAEMLAGSITYNKRKNHPSGKAA